MGCELSKLATTKSRNQTGNDGSSPPPPPPAATDPRLPLTARQKFTVIASWKAVSRALEPTGIYMFIRLFEENAELLNMFTKFRDQKTKEQQSTSMELAEHAKTVMTTLDEGIKSLDDMDAFLTYLHEVGASHTKIPGFNRQYFWKIEKPFLDAVERTLEDRYSENVENIYKLTIKFIIETLIDGFDKAQSDKAKS
ncbi:PREDICTED: neuroglobin-like [Acromyrmex echinatior]|uniref:neuroglobin-like n=1 Tax=Acromyrmex echinatior TaxID=103372 RepID=UPI000581020B|nr:PREDICTED: neuroglobin-like [Acromyrmex echinatior]XP_011059261.1 PREDICTED: neuroglobin-like [Acromyrmex echinatior]XP_011059262.1 PREDICTED: neuroglobin-like [Acromyrmex echinatior]XP_011059263.1 PREDICTED: neuroglobin-like [Acromyrmex echinatior]XP_011059264.1 PREDICTED: neuroglobin-like [Acromyrmex echinatior]XP_011059265.1 PREDICTED: neuroglobin-like [Acromyrmex echinatior]XP_011059267.1 PREDICTED: neuroglobin-like [Acromyrmex echinatior]XP_011059268.1 PREDICTED: neuroglobin-like [Ac